MGLRFTFGEGNVFTLNEPHVIDTAHLIVQDPRRIWWVWSGKAGEDSSSAKVFLDQAHRVEDYRNALELGCTWLCYLKKLFVGLCLHLTTSQLSSAGFSK